MQTITNKLIESLSQYFTQTTRPARVRLTASTTTNNQDDFVFERNQYSEQEWEHFTNHFGLVNHNALDVTLVFSHRDGLLILDSVL